MSASSLLAEHDLPELVHDLHRRSWTGSLLLRRGQDTIRITVKEGRLVFASSSNPDHRLGPLLLRRGAIGLPQLEAAGEVIGPGKRLGTILVERGVVEPKELVRAVVDQTQEIIYVAFQWTEGRSELSAGEEAAESITLNISTPNLILEGIRRIESWSRVARGAGDLDTRYVRCGSEADRKAMSLTREQQQMIDDLARPRTVESLCGRRGLTDFEVCRNLWAFRVIGVIERVPSKAGGPSFDDDGLEYVLPNDNG
jgi:hypothetical protein